jgi:hypothetical protein
LVEGILLNGGDGVQRQVQGSQRLQRREGDGRNGPYPVAPQAQFGEVDEPAEHLSLARLVLDDPVQLVKVETPANKNKEHHVHTTDLFLNLKRVEWRNWKDKERGVGGDVDEDVSVRGR